MNETLSTFKAIGHPVRYEIIELLKEKPLTAGEIGKNFDLAPATISHHLKQLKESELIRERKEKNFIIYELNMTLFQETLLWFQSFL